MIERPLSDRRWLLTVGDLDVSELDLQFTVNRSTTHEPNTAEIRIYNLSADSRARLTAAERPRVVLRAGYAGDGDPPPRLFNGSARDITSEPDGQEIVTTLQCSDSGREIQTARISRSYNPGVRVITVLRDAVEALGIGEGNLREFESSYATRTGATIFADGYVADGPARRIVQDIARAAGLRWSVQNGALQLMRSGQALQTTAPSISSASGLIGTPTRDDKGKVSATALMQPGLEPGRRIVMASREIRGGYEVRQVELRGDTAGTDWYAIMDLAPLT